MNRKEKKIQLQNQVKEFSEDLKSLASDYKILGKDVLIIGGILVAGYTLMRLFDDDNEEEDFKDSILSSTIKAAATSIALSFVKDKLMDYLDDLKSDNDESSA